MHLRGLVEPGRIDEEDDAGDHNLWEPSNDQEKRCEHDPPEAKFGQADCVPEVEDVPGDPEDQRPEQDHRGERGDHHGESAGDQRADPEDAQQHAEDGAHTERLASSKHGDARARATPIAYKRNYLVRGDEINIEDDTINFDVVTELVFPDRAYLAWGAQLSASSSDEPIIAADESRFLDRWRTRAYVVEEYETLR